jgi:hypothetical protein
MLWLQRSKALFDMEIETEIQQRLAAADPCQHLAAQSLDPDRGQFRGHIKTQGSIRTGAELVAHIILEVKSSCLRASPESVRILIACLGSFLVPASRLPCVWRRLAAPSLEAISHRAQGFAGRFPEPSGSLKGSPLVP